MRTTNTKVKFNLAPWVHIRRSAYSQASLAGIAGGLSADFQSTPVRSESSSALACRLGGAQSGPEACKFGGAHSGPEAATCSVSVGFCETD